MRERERRIFLFPSFLLFPVSFLYVPSFLPFARENRRGRRTRKTLAGWQADASDHFSSQRGTQKKKSRTEEGPLRIDGWTDRQTDRQSLPPSNRSSQKIEREGPAEIPQSTSMPPSLAQSVSHSSSEIFVEDKFRRQFFAEADDRGCGLSFIIHLGGIPSL